MTKSPMKTSTIGPKTVVIGNVHGDGDLELHGRVEGDITVEGNVLVASGAEVKGSVSAAAIRVAGSVEGNLQAAETVSVEPDARVVGDMTTPRVSIAEGAVVRGMVRTDGADRQRQKPNPPAPREVVSAPRIHTRVVLPAPERPLEPSDADEFETDFLPPPKRELRDKRPPEPKVPTLAKGTKGKKKGDKRRR
jgi:cytoskeletal protein CcmA (bactofilin family)